MLEKQFTLDDSILLSGKKMKILFISENYYPNTSGVPVVVQYLAESLAKENDVNVLTTMQPGLKKHEVVNGVNVTRINVYINELKIYCGEKKAFIKEAIDQNADIYIFECVSCVTSDILLPYLKLLPGIKLLHSHGFSGLTLKMFEKMQTIKNTVGNTYNYFRWGYFFNKTFPMYVNDFDGVFCLSKLDSSYKYLCKVFNGKVDVLGNAAEEIFFDNDLKGIPDKYCKISGDGYYVSVANYMSVKNQIGMLEEYYRTQHTDSYDLVFIGREKNEYYEKLIEYNDRLNRKKGTVHFLTEVDRKDIPRIINGAKLYLAGSRAEGYSISLIEAMSQGTPFVSTNVGNARELPGGLTVDNIDDLHSGIDKLIDDIELYNNLSLSGKKFAEMNCKISAATDQLMHIINASMMNKGKIND